MKRFLYITLLFLGIGCSLIAYGSDPVANNDDSSGIVVYATDNSTVDVDHSALAVDLDRPSGVIIHENGTSVTVDRIIRDTPKCKVRCYPVDSRPPPVLT